MSVVINGTTGIDAPGLSIEGTPVGLKADVQEFTSSGTWTKPANAKLVYVEIWGGGGGGGSGGRAASGSNRFGGSGGSGSMPFLGVFRASEFTSTVSVTIGAGGSGGAAQTVNSTDGNTGSNGGTSTFGSYITALGGNGGNRGWAGGSIGVTNREAPLAVSQQFSNGNTLTSTSAGGGSDLSGALGGIGGYGVPIGSKATCGGGGGGLIATGNGSFSAGLGGQYYTHPTDSIGGVRGNGVGNGVSGAAGSSFGVGGGGGGPGNSVAAGAGGAGGTAAGGGGGGGSLNGFTSGAGGAGGNGFCRVTTYY